jgi:hypothetical protein
MKTPGATVMAGAQTTINNQLKLSAAMAMEMATMKATTAKMKMKPKAAAVAVEATAKIYLVAHDFMAQGLQAQVVGSQEPLPELILLRLLTLIKVEVVEEQVVLRPQPRAAGKVQLADLE